MHGEAMLGGANMRQGPSLTKVAHDLNTCGVLRLHMQMYCFKTCDSCHCIRYSMK